MTIATHLTEEGDEKNHGRKNKIILGLVTTVCVTINLLVMALLVSFLKIYCVPIFILVGFLSVGGWNFESREEIKNTILNGLTCMFVPCLQRHSGSGEVTVGLAITYYVIYNFGYGLTSRACLLQMIKPFGDQPVFYCNTPPNNNMTCNNSTVFSAPQNLTNESLELCSTSLFSFEVERNYCTYCIDGYLDSYDDVWNYCVVGVAAVLCLFLCLKLAMLGKKAEVREFEMRNIRHLGGKSLWKTHTLRN